MDKRKREEAHEPAEKKARPTTPRIPSYSEPITILVGPEAASFWVHRERLSAKSAYFNDLSSEKELKLSTVEPKNFKIYQHWVYSDQVSVKVSPDVSTTYKMLVELYKMGQQLIDYAFCDRIIDQIVGYAMVPEQLPTHEVCQYVWNHAMEAWKVQLLLLDLTLWNVDPKQFLENLENYPGRFVMTAMKRMVWMVARQRKGGSWPSILSSRYHLSGENGKGLE